MQLVKRLLPLLVLTISALGASAQDYAEYYKFAEEAQEKSMLFRGKQSISYPFQYNGTFYWYSRTFTEGDVFYNGKLYRDILVNVNAHTRDLLVKQSESFLHVMVERAHTDWFTMGGKMYVNLFARGVGGAAEGYYEVIHEGHSAALYKRIEKIIRNDANNKNGAAIGYDDPNYNERVYDYFANRLQYFFLKDGSWIQVKDISDLVKCYPARKKELRHFVKSACSGKKADFEKDAQALLKHIDNE